MIDLTHYTVEARSTYSDGSARLEVECDRCPRWCLPDEPYRANVGTDLLAWLERHERKAHPT